MTNKQIQALAEFFTGPELTLCTLALASIDKSTVNTGYHRARRFFALRETFGVPAECDQEPECMAYIKASVTL